MVTVVELATVIADDDGIVVVEFEPLFVLVDESA